MRARQQWILEGLAVLFLLATATSRAANAPTFRHALERWAASDYEIVVFHRGEMDSAGQSLVDQLRIARGQVFANVDVKTVDVSGQMEIAMENLWTCQTNPLPPWVVVRAPETSADASPVWAGHLSESSAGALLDSPARRKIAEHLLRGATAVWVVLESGEAMRDEAAVDTLSGELRRLEKNLQLPKPGSGGPKLRSPLPVTVDFALVRVTRTDPAEEFLVTLLQHGKPLFSARPAAFAVYGRGRMLGALVGREIEAEAIGEVCSTLVAACSRESKDQNPGRDLLLAANWDSIFNPAPAKNLAVATPTIPGSPSPSSTVEPLSEQTSGWRMSYLLLAGFAITVVAAFLIRARNPGDGGVR